MGTSVTPDDAIDAIRGSGGAQPGQRALHAKGTLYREPSLLTPKRPSSLVRSTSTARRCRRWFGFPTGQVIRSRLTARPAYVGWR
jgi:hypothetical protein